MSSAGIRRVVGSVFLFGGITFGLFLLFEGTASFLIFLRTFQTQRETVALAEVAHADFDPELGWVSRKGVRIDDFYGPGKDLVLNSQGFRDEEDFTPHVPGDTRRAICSGDSFTLGFGVGNGDSWCAVLEALNPGLQTVNMGQGGYGLDQVYLWYLRDGLELEHDTQLLAFIQDDFRRLGVRHFLGYGKPTLYVEADGLRVEPARLNGPVRRWLAKNGHLFRELRSVEFLGRAVRKLGIAGQVAGPSERIRNWRVAEAIFDDLAEKHRAEGTELVLVFLPTLWDHDGEFSLAWRELVRDYSVRTGVSLVDLIAEYQAMSEDEARALFIPAGEPGEQHLNEKGNLWVAERLTERVPALQQ